MNLYLNLLPFQIFSPRSPIVMVIWYLPDLQIICKKSSLCQPLFTNRLLLVIQRDWQLVFSVE